MISHAETDEKIATAWYGLLGKVFPMFEIRYSSNPHNPAFESTRDFPDQIQQWIRESDLCLTIQTPNSSVRPWIIWEAGMARALDKAIFVLLYGVKPGNLKNPLNSHPHYDGTDGDAVRQVIRGISECTSAPYGESDFAESLKKYQKLLRASKYLFESQQVRYEKRIYLEFTYDQCQALKKDPKVPAKVIVRDDLGSLTIFGYDDETLSVTWDRLLEKLIEDDEGRPWPGSAIAWTKVLGRALRKALNRQLTPDDPEGLPLYWESRLRGGISYRPSITEQTVFTGKTIFAVTFTQLPPELTARPTGPLDTLFHYLDFARMLRWGVLKSPRFDDFFEGNLSDEMLRQKNAEFLDTLLNIQIEFQNRGLQKDQILGAFTGERRQKIQTILDDYHRVVGQLEPENKPGSELIRKLRPELMSLNATFLNVLHEGIGNLLAGELSEQKGSEGASVPVPSEVWPQNVIASVQAVNA
jgi:hypothetical protein